MNKIGITVIGASLRSTALLEYIKKHTEEAYITGIYDIIPERGQFLLEEFGYFDAVTYDSLDQAVTDSNAQAIFISTPDYAHVEPAILAVQAGKHVYCEKPLATTLADCDKIIDAAKKSNAIFYLGMNMRHVPIFELAYKTVSSGKLGKLLTMEADEHYYGGRTYFRRWNRLRKFGGGLWITKACHDFDVLSWISGGRPKRIFATCNLSHYKPDPEKGKNCRTCSIQNRCPDFYDITDIDISGKNESEKKLFEIWDALGRITEEKTGFLRDTCLYNSDKDTFDNGIAVVEFDNDVRASYTLNVVSALSTRKILLTGTEGCFEGDLMTCKAIFWKRHTGEKQEFNLTEEMQSRHSGADDKIFTDFLNCCRTGKSPRSNWADGRLGIEVALAATKSSDNNCIIKLETFETA